MFNPKYYYVINICTCSESGGYGINLDMNFENIEDALLYCKYKNFWNEQSDRSNRSSRSIKSEFYVKYDITEDEYNVLYDVYDCERHDKLYNREIKKSFDDFYDHNDCFDLYNLTFDVNEKYVNNVQLISHENKTIFVNYIHQLIKNKEQDKIEISYLIKYILLVENCEQDNYDEYCTIKRLFLSKASLYQIKMMKNILYTNEVDCDGELLLSSLLSNKSFSINDLFSEKLITIDNLMERSCNHNGHMLASNNVEYEYIIQYLSGECDKYGKMYDYETSNERYKKIMEIIQNDDDVEY